MMMIRWSPVVLVLALLLGGCAQSRHDDDDEMALSEVPEGVVAAAQKAVPGLRVESAEKEVENGVTLYSLEGTAKGKEYCVEVTPAGKVLEVELEDDDDGEDHDEDEDEDEEHEDDDDK